MTATNLTPQERFLSRVRIDEASGCHIWEGNIHVSGYGSFQIKLLNKWRSMNAHRAAWILFRGPIPDGKKCCHKCDVRRCVNLEHIFLGDDQDNMEDMARKWRGRGSKRGLPFGVSILKKGNSILYRAQVGYMGSVRYGGCFRSIEAAHEEALRMKTEFLGLTGGNSAVVS